MSVATVHRTFAYLVKPRSIIASVNFYHFEYITVCQPLHSLAYVMINPHSPSQLRKKERKKRKAWHKEWMKEEKRKIKIEKINRTEKEREQQVNACVVPH